MRESLDAALKIKFVIFGHFNAEALASKLNLKPDIIQAIEVQEGKIYQIIFEKEYTDSHNTEKYIEDFLVYVSSIENSLNTLKETHTFNCTLNCITASSESKPTQNTLLSRKSIKILNSLSSSFCIAYYRD